METRWLYVTSEEFSKLREASKDVCIIPMGCVEKHGLHLPLGTDIMQVSKIAWMASQLETVCVFPDFTFGDVPENYPNMPDGSITLPVETEMLVLEQLCDQVARNGFKKIIIFNGHGGNKPWISTFLRKVENKPHDYVLMNLNIKCSLIGRMAEILLENGSGSIPELNEEDEKLILQKNEEKVGDGHATFSETAYIMGMAPETVKLDRLGIESGKSIEIANKYKKHGISIRDGGWGYNYPNCIEGDDPDWCNERIGKAALRIEAERVAKALKFLKEDEDLIKWHNQNWNTNI